MPATLYHADEFTRKHCLAWCESVFGWQYADQFAASLIEFLQRMTVDDAEWYLSQGWPRINAEVAGET